MPLSLLIAHLTFEVAIILIFKHAAVLCLSGRSTKVALTQAESDFHKADTMSKIQKHFTAFYEEYTVEQIVDFLVDLNIGLSTFTFIQIVAYTTFERHLRIGVGNRYVMKRLSIVSFL